MRPIRRGDTIALVSPASRAEETVFAEITHILANRGYKTKRYGGPGLGIGRFAASDDDRARHLIDAFEDPDVNLVLSARGGYGSGRILEMLDVTKITEKAFVGYSDVSSLLLHLNAKAKLTTFHGPMASDLTVKANPQSLEWFFSMLEGQRQEYVLCDDDFLAHRTGTAAGPVWGGNISMIESLLGTDSIQVPDNAIVLLEDVNEFMYAFDRSMVHLKRAGIFDKASAILLADLNLKDAGDRDNSLGLLQEEVIEMNFEGFSGPIAYGLPCGHTERQMTLPIGAQAHLSVTEQKLELSFNDFWKPTTNEALAA